MLKITSFAVIGIAAIATSAQKVAITEQPNYVCYMTNQLGQVIDLSDSLCRPKASEVVPAANIDTLFLNAYKQAAIAKYPYMQNVLLQQPPEINIKYARAVCNGLKAGLTAEQIQTLQTEQISKINQIQPAPKRPVVDLSAIQLFAPKYYCPQFK